jgi:hypothetical protein
VQVGNSAIRFAEQQLDDASVEKEKLVPLQSSDTLNGCDSFLIEHSGTLKVPRLEQSKQINVSSSVPNEFDALDALVRQVSTGLINKSTIDYFECEVDKYRKTKELQDYNKAVLPADTEISKYLTFQEVIAGLRDLKINIRYLKNRNRSMTKENEQLVVVIRTLMLENMKLQERLDRAQVNTGNVAEKIRKYKILTK